MVPTRPPHWKIRRARAVVYSDGKRVLTVCELCGLDVYVFEGQTVCTECRSENRRGLLKVKPTSVRSKRRKNSQRITP